MPTNQEFNEEESLIGNSHPDQDKSDAKIASILSNQLAEFKKPIEKESALTIESIENKLHTIDYFASQGIQIDLSKIPQDKLTTKLRRFTDWLKDMKNHNPNPIDLGTSPEQEKKVAETALISNESKEILTETMAEVLAKQGQIDKAIQLYIKLSFSNPEKTAYFADKIQHLKGI
jgi:site-specific recombinase XerD